MRRLAICALWLICTLASAAGQDDADLDALATADKATAAPEHASDWHAFVEGAFGNATQRYGLPDYRSERLSADVALDKTLGAGWRVLFADRLDGNWQGQEPNEYKVNTLKELYLSWQVTPNEIIDVGRINTRYGVGYGYNPTDYFKDNAVRSVVSVDPNSLRNNRLGSVMVRTQMLWNGGALTALVSPKLASQPSADAFSVDLGATNNTNRWLLAVSQRVAENVNPQFLLSGEQGKSAQLGFDLTHVLGDATVVFVEWSGGQGASLYSEALGNPTRQVFRNRMATGLSYTTTNKISLTLEAEYNGSALDSADWAALATGPIVNYLQYRNYAQAVQELPTRKSLFINANWQDAMISHLDLNALARQDLTDQSRLSWIEARYHWDHTDVALQWQRYGGKPWSDFGVVPQRTTWQSVMTYYF